MLTGAKGTFGLFITEHQCNTTYNLLVEYLNPAAFITMANKEDNPTFKEAMVSPDTISYGSQNMYTTTTASLRFKAETKESYSHIRRVGIQA